jgi:hypothetical protein
LGLVFLFFVFNANAQLSPVDPHPTPVGFACEPTLFDDEPCIQSQCDDIQRPRITTHPDRPVNTFNQSRLNLFDWRQPTYPVLLATGSRIPSPLESPFFQTDNPNILNFTHPSTKDMRPEDGWEILKYNLGGALSASGINTHTVSVPYLVLYNRFLSKMRVFVARGDDAYSTNYSKITLMFSGNNKSSLLDLHRGALIPLDAPFISGNMQAGANVVNMAGKWSYAEFSMVYDPCTCEYQDNSLTIAIDNIDISNIALSGTVEGTLISRNGNSIASNTNSDGFSYKDVVKVANYYVKGYGVANKFIDDSKKIIDNTLGVGSDSVNVAQKKEALNQLGRILNSANGLLPLLRGGLQSVPYVTAALSIYDMFTAGGTNTGPQKVEIMPMALSANVKLNGTIQRETNYANVTMATPGSERTVANIANPDYPYYNETLGVFNLLETPNVIKSLDYRIVENSQRDVVIDKYSYRLASPVKYVINPASGLEVQNVQAAFVLRHTKIAENSNFSNKISDTMATTEHVNLFIASPFGQLITPRANDNITSQLDNGKIWIQLVLNLRRKDGKGENVLLVVTYPTKFVDAGTACKNCFGQVSQPVIHKFCTDAKSIYRENRVLAKEKAVETTMQPTIQRFKAFPNPVDNLLHINFDSETEQTVKAWLTDVTGRVVSAILEQKTGKGNSNLDLPTQDLPEGLHLFVFEVNGIKKVQKVVIRH